MELQPDWGFLITTVGIILSVISFFQAIKFPPDDKDLTLVTWKTGLRRTPGEADKTFLRLIFQNTGRGVLYRQDFAKDITIKLPNVTITSMETHANCGYNKASAIIENDTVTISFDFLEKGKYLRANLYFDGQAPHAHFAFKIIGGVDTNEGIETDARWHNYFVGEREGRTILYIRPLFAITSFLIQFHILRHMVGLETNEVIDAVLHFNALAPYILIALMPTILISVNIALWAGRLFMPFATTARREKNWWRKSVSTSEATGMN